MCAFESSVVELDECCRLCRHVWSAAVVFVLYVYMTSCLHLVVSEHIIQTAFSIVASVAFLSFSELGITLHVASIILAAEVSQSLV